MKKLLMMLTALTVCGAAVMAQSTNTVQDKTIKPTTSKTATAKPAKMNKDIASTQAGKQAATSRQIASTTTQESKPGKHKQSREKSGKHAQRKASHDQEIKENKHKG